MYGFVRVAAAIPKLEVGNCVYNSNEILQLIREAAKRKVKILTFPELCLTGYTCGDLFYQSTLLTTAENSLKHILTETKSIDMFITVGLPVGYKNRLYNCAAAIYKGKIVGLVPKIFIPNQREFYEKRWFDSGKNLKNLTLNLCGQSVAFGSDLLFTFTNFKNLMVGIEICEDVWSVIPPSSYQVQAGATVILNLSASNELVSKSAKRENLIKEHSSRITATYVYSSAGFYESTTDLVFSGHSLICENGTTLAESTKFSMDNQLVVCDTDIELLTQIRYSDSAPENCDDNFKFLAVDLQNEEFPVERFVWKKPFIPQNVEEVNPLCEELFMIQLSGLAKRLSFTKIKKSVIGISGGLDSTLALLCIVKAYDYLKLDRAGIIGVTMPGFGTTDRTYNNALSLMEALGTTVREISIKKACLQHFEDIGHDSNVHDVTYENAQARERTQILMDLANKESGLVIGTGDLSELALGFATYNGDHMSMYGVNAGIPKTLVRVLVEWVAASDLLDSSSAKILLDIVNTPVSPELLPPSGDDTISQVTEEIVGPYELHDFYLYYVLKYGFSPKKIIFLAELAFQGEFDRETITKWLKIFYRRFFTQQFKRSCLPDGPKVLDISLSPRGDWRMPSDASYELWLADIE